MALVTPGERWREDERAEGLTNWHIGVNSNWALKTDLISVQSSLEAAV
jgi:hypothetical protein